MVSQDSKEQQHQQSSNQAQRKDSQPGIDKKLNGPNRPST